MLQPPPKTNPRYGLGGNAWIFLNLEFGTSLSIAKAAYIFSIESANYFASLEYLFKESQGYGTDICLTEELFNSEKLHFVDGEMTIKINGSLVMEKEKSTAIECLENIVATIHEQNFKTFVGEKSIKVHKPLLLDSSPYFVGMFNSGMIESTEMKTTITDFDYEIVEAGLLILYTPSKIPTNFSFEQMLELLRFSDKYDIQQIKDLMENYFIENLSPTNVCPHINFVTTTVSAPKFYSKCYEYFAQLF